MRIVADIEAEVEDGSTGTEVLVGHEVAVIVNAVVKVRGARSWKMNKIIGFINCKICKLSSEAAIKWLIHRIHNREVLESNPCWLHILKECKGRLALLL